MKAFLIFLAVAIAQTTAAQDIVLVQTPAVYVDGAAVNAEVKQECDLPNLLGSNTLSTVQKLMPESAPLALSSTRKDHHVLTLSILSAHGLGGAGAFSGGKSITVRADLLLADQRIGSKTLRTSSRGGISGAFNGMCAIQKSNTENAGSQIAAWVQSLIKSPPKIAEQKIVLITPITYSDDNTVRKAVKDECALPHIAEAYLLEQSNIQRLPLNVAQKETATGKALRASIISAEGSGGGAFTGEKRLRMHVELLENGKATNSKDFERTTNSGLMAGSCDIMEKLLWSFAAQAIKWSGTELGIISKAIAPKASDAETDEAR